MRNRLKVCLLLLLSCARSEIAGQPAPETVTPASADVVNCERDNGVASFWTVPKQGLTSSGCPGKDCRYSASLGFLSVRQRESTLDGGAAAGGIFYGPVERIGQGEFVIALTRPWSLCLTRTRRVVSPSELHGSTLDATVVVPTMLSSTWRLWPSGLSSCGRDAPLSGPLQRLAFAGDEATIDGAEYYGTIVNGETGETLAIL